MELLGLIIFGGVVGALARLFMKGKQPLGILMTIVLGMLGALVGYYLSSLLGVNDTKGIDWIRLFISVISTIIFIGGYLSFTGKKNTENNTIG